MKRAGKILKYISSLGMGLMLFVHQSMADIKDIHLNLVANKILIKEIGEDFIDLLDHGDEDGAMDFLHQNNFNAPAHGMIVRAFFEATAEQRENILDIFRDIHDNGHFTKDNINQLLPNFNNPPARESDAPTQSGLSYKEYPQYSRSPDYGHHSWKPSYDQNYPYPWHRYSQYPWYPNYPNQNHNYGQNHPQDRFSDEQLIQLLHSRSPERLTAIINGIYDGNNYGQNHNLYPQYPPYPGYAYPQYPHYPHYGSNHRQTQLSDEQLIHVLRSRSQESLNAILKRIYSYNYGQHNYPTYPNYPNYGQHHNW